MNKKLVLLLFFISAQNIFAKGPEAAPVLKVKNAKEVRDALDSASYKLFLDNIVDLFNFDISKPQSQKLVAQWNQALGKLRYFLNNKSSGTKTLQPIFEKINAFDTNLITKIFAFSSVGKNELKEGRFARFDDTYTKLSNEIKDGIKSLSDEIKGLSSVPKESKELLLYLVDDIYRSVYLKFATDVDKYVKRLKK